MAEQTILLVDDDDIFVEAVSAVLEGQYRVRRAANGTEGLEMIAEERPDVVILDAEEYERLVTTLNLAVLLAKGEDDVRHGRVRAASDFFEEVLRGDT